MLAKNVYRTGPYTSFTYWGGVFSGTSGSRSHDFCSPSGIVHGNFRDPNSWEYHAYKVTFNPGTLYTSYHGPGWEGLQDVRIGYLVGRDEPYMPPWSSYRDAVYNSALARFNAKLRGGVDLGVTLAESRQTYAMLKNLALALKRLYDAVKRGRDYMVGIGDTGDIANGWLALQYGWKPLMSDIFGILNQLLEVNFSTTRRITGTFTTQVKYAGPGASIAPFYQTYGDNLSFGKASCRIVATYEIKGQNLSNWTSLNPLSLAWELLPYSFVVDWVYNVGAFLKASETAALYASEFKGGYVSELYAIDGSEVPHDTALERPNGNPPLSYLAIGFESYYRRREFVRTKLLEPPSPRAPQFEVDLGSQQLLSLAALLRQLF